MKRLPKVVVVMPAHNAARTLRESFKKLPKKYVDLVILVDDASTDNTFKVASKLPLKAYRNAINLGYGGNLKVCLVKALESGADIIIEFHPDNQYDPANLHLFLEKARQGYDFALGSRFIHPKEALERHMPLAKFIANRSLSFIDQFILGIELSEFHSGFRMYTRKLLESVPFLQNSDDYLFSFEIIVQAVFFKFKVAEVQISCDYHPAMHTADLRRSTIYALGTFKTLYQYVQSKFRKRHIGPFKMVTRIDCPICNQSITRKEYDVTDAVSNKIFQIYFCTPCQIAYTHPQPRNMSLFYPNAYYSQVKTLIYGLLQYRRLEIVQSLLPEGKILDIGCGEGSIGKQLMKRGYQYQGIETPFSKIKKPYVKNVGTEGMREKPNSYNIITFWESFEHIRDPLNILKKTFQALKSNGYIIIECPKFNSWEKLPFGSRWFHLDPPRHFFHYSENGLRQLLQKHKLHVINQETLFAPEYIPIGLAQSILYRLSPRLNVFAQEYRKKRSFGVPLLLVCIGLLMFPFSYLFYLLKGSPIQLIIAQKK